MAMPRLHVKQIVEILRLRFDEQRSHREISASVNCGRTSIGDCLARFKASGLLWPLPAGTTEEEIELRLYPEACLSGATKQPPDWGYIHRELKKKSVTRMLLWLEYREDQPDGYQYSQFCLQYQEWAKSADFVFRNEHRAGEKAFIDYVGQTMPIWDAKTGECKHAQIFLGVLGASNFTFAEATWTQTIPDWLASHKRMFAAFGGVPEILVPDNLRSAVSKACRYDPVINPAYYAMAKHYGLTVIPARARKPRDKAKAEAGVLLVERWILAALRNRKFFSLDELNAAIAVLLTRLNEKKFQKIDGCRLSLFETIDRPALKALPVDDFTISEYKIARVNINYHVELERHNYSVPYTCVQKEVTIRYTARVVEVLYKGESIASHLRRNKPGGYSTIDEHMPPRHKAHVKWSPERMINWVGEAGPSTKKMAEVIIASRRHPEESYKVILGMIRLGEKNGQDRLEAACKRALELNTPYYRSIKNILNAGLDKALMPHKDQTTDLSINHGNIRGPEYYNN
jgi:transposase